jgi:hypothetical protein
VLLNSSSPDYGNYLPRREAAFKRIVGATKGDINLKGVLDDSQVPQIEYVALFQRPFMH